MKTVISKGYFRYEIIQWHDVKSDQNIIKFDNSTSARTFLHGFIHEHLNIKAFRNILSGAAVSFQITRLTDHQVIDLLANKLATGQLKLVLLTEMKPPEVKKGSALAPPSEGPIASTSVRQAPELSTSPPPDPQAQNANQANTFKQASDSGSPFCEE